MTRPFNFFTHKVKFTIRKRKKLNAWLIDVIESCGKIAGSVNFIFVNEQYLYKINKKYLNVAAYTDTISFSLSEEEKIVSGDIFISIERVKENAVKYKEKFDEELHRVMVHSVLHLIGYSDLEEKEQLAMRQKEDKFLRLLAKL
jgi:rRNA maturation RNase YbeY